MTVVCAWCGAYIRDHAPINDPRRIYSVCLQCFNREAATIPLSESWSDPPETLPE